MSSTANGETQTLWKRFGRSWLGGLLVWLLPVGLLLPLAISSYVLYSTSGQSHYIITQVAQESPMFWAHVADITAGIRGSAPLAALFILIGLGSLLAPFARYGRRAIPVLIALMLAGIGGSTIVDAQSMQGGSGGLDMPVYAPEALRVSALIGAVVLLLIGGMLVLWDYFSKREVEYRFLVVTGIVATAFLAISYWSSTLFQELSFENLPHSWTMTELAMNLVAVSIIPPTLFLAAALLITELNHSKAKSILLPAALVLLAVPAPFLINSVSAYDLPAESRDWPSPGDLQASNLTFASWSPPDNSRVHTEEHSYPGLSGPLRELLQKEQWRNDRQFTLSSRHPNYIQLRNTPVQERVDFLLRLREEFPEVESIMTGLVTTVITQHQPLPDEQLQRWFSIVIRQPTHLTEDVGLLTNLVLAGEREKALELSNHIRSIMDSEDFRSPDQPGLFGDESDLRVALFEDLTERAENLPERSASETATLKVRLLDAEGEPVADTPVGIHYSTDIAVENGQVVEKAFQSGRLGRFDQTDGDGTVEFTKLNPTGYGVTAVSGWPGSELGIGEVAVPTEPIPDPPPPGETTVTLQQVPVGTWTTQSAGSGKLDLQLDPAAEGEVECAGSRCEEAGLATLDPSEPVDRHATLIPSDDRSLNTWLAETDDSGRPVQFWKPENFEQRVEELEEEAEEGQQEVQADEKQEVQADE